MGLSEGLSVGLNEGLSEGLSVGLNEGLSEGLSVGLTVGLSEGLSVGAFVGFLIQIPFLLALVIPCFRPALKAQPLTF